MDTAGIPPALAGELTEAAPAAEPSAWQQRLRERRAARGRPAPAPDAAATLALDPEDALLAPPVHAAIPDVTPLPDLRSRPSQLSVGLLCLVAGLMGIGLVTIFSASQALDRTLDPANLDGLLHNQAMRQLVLVPIGFVLMLAFQRLPYRFWRLRESLWTSPAVWLWAIACVCLVLVFVPGVGLSVNGARRWIRVAAGLQFQPSELAKVALVFLVAALMTSGRLDLRSFTRGLVPLCALIGVTCALVAIEDLGTAVLMGAVAGGLLIIGGAVWWHLALPAAAAGVAVAGLIVIEPYRMARLTGFMDIWSDPQGKGYHPIQSLITISEGGLWGTGLGGSVQKLGYLPESKTDFVFSVLCSEMGLLGAAAVILMFVAFVWIGRKIFARAPDRLGRLLAMGITLTIGLQALMNIAVVTVSAPTKGISLPLVSAGGSSIVFLALAIGTLANIGRRRA